MLPDNSARLSFKAATTCGSAITRILLKRLGYDRHVNGTLQAARGGGCYIRPDIHDVGDHVGRGQEAAEQYADREEHRPSLAARSGRAGEQFEESHRNGRQQYAGEHDVQGDASPVERRIENFLAHPAAADEVVKRPQLRQRVRFVYPAHLRTRKPSGDMMRKLSVTLSQNVFHLLGTSRRRKPSTAWQKPL